MNLTGHPDLDVNHICDGIPEEIRACRGSTILAAWAVGGNVRQFTIKLAIVTTVVANECIVS